MGHEGPTLTDRRWLIADERGSIVAVTDGSGQALAINTYDEYGQPGANNLGRFQYTGQAWLPELGLYHYKARFYDPRLGRFLQPDPIGLAGGLNLYAYAGGDPVNASDPWGLLPNWLEKIHAKFRADPPQRAQSGFKTSSYVRVDEYMKWEKATYHRDGNVTVHAPVYQYLRSQHSLSFVSFSQSGNLIYSITGTPDNLNQDLRLDLPINASEALGTRYSNADSNAITIVFFTPWQATFASRGGGIILRPITAGLGQRGPFIRLQGPGTGSSDIHGYLGGYFIVHNSLGQPISIVTGRPSGNPSDVHNHFGGVDTRP